MIRTAFDLAERHTWAVRANACAACFGKLCAHPAPQPLDAAGVVAGSRVLDVGTGTGTVGALAGERGATVSAVDSDPGMVERAAGGGGG